MTYPSTRPVRPRPVEQRDLEIARQTGVLDLRERGITSLPDAIGDLTDLREFWLYRNQLTYLPDWIGRLTRLRQLWLDSNELTSIPSTIGRLKSLQQLGLYHNRLTELPPAIGGLTSLKQLWLSDNSLTNLPNEIGGLTNLEELGLFSNRLTSLPAAIGRLTRLVDLGLSNNELSGLPASVGNLTRLERLGLINNRLTALPTSIEQLVRLRQLGLRNNQLRTLPRQLATLLAGSLELLDLEGNPLRDPLPQLYARGPDALATYLLTLSAPTEVFEAKVLFVGQGTVGKSSLLDLLRGKRFDPRRSSTHDIEVHELNVQSSALGGGNQRHAKEPAPLTLRCWDFGGQAVYRITHQFLYSPHALYVLVWNASAGAELSDVRGWLRRIRARAGHLAQVVLVATHADEASPDLDYARLNADFPGMIRSWHAVDNASGNGVPDVAAAITKHAASLPHVGTILSTNWAAVREEVSVRGMTRAYLSLHEYQTICEERNVTVPDEQRTLAALMHDLGQVVYHGDVEGLRDSMILDPEWLATAVGAVLADPQTRQNRGVLDHARLPSIWTSGTGQHGYPSEYHGFLLRLTEHFDVSWRLDDMKHSLIAQLVPHERPNLPWDLSTTVPQGQRRLRAVCRFTSGESGGFADRFEPAPGLISALTVRHHDASVGLHWRTGVFLRHPNVGLDSTALIELLPAPGSVTHAEDAAAQIMIEVRAPDPNFYFYFLLGSVEHLRGQRWPALVTELLVPCPGLKAGRQCNARFALSSLQDRLVSGREYTECIDCGEVHATAVLLTGFHLALDPAPTDSLYDPALAQLVRIERLLKEVATARQVNEVRDEVTAMRMSVKDLQRDVAAATYNIWKILVEVGKLVTDVPRLFTLRQLEQDGVRGLWRVQFEIVLWCECPGRYHPVPEATFVLNQPKKWLQVISPYVKAIAFGLKPFIDVASQLSDLALTPEQLEIATRHLQLLKAMTPTTVTEQPTEEIPVVPGGRPAGAGQPPEPTSGPALHALRALMSDIAPGGYYPDLEQVATATGHVLWMCSAHAGHYRPEPVALDGTP